jgi:hypothetical protein
VRQGSPRVVRPSGPGGVVVIAGGGIWAAFQETEFHGGELETAILCSNPANANMDECLSKDTSGGDETPGGSDPNDDSDDDDDDDDESGTDPGNTNGGIN